MRWPLRYQIMVPMAAVMVSAVLAVEGIGTLLAVGDARSRVDGQIREVAQIATAANFPLTTPVLRQMRALSGAQLVVVDGSGTVLAVSDVVDDVAKLSSTVTPHADSVIAESDRVTLGERSFFHVVAALPDQGTNGARLHILYPVDDYRQAWRREVVPPLTFVAAALPVVLLLAYATSSRIAGRVGRLREQVDRIAQGEFQQFASPEGDDEIRALADDVNRMARMLADYEQEVRRTERMRTLALLGGGIAHQLRNSATGCAMAVDLHAEECPLGDASESLAVAKRQLRLMEEFIQRFLHLGKPEETVERRDVDLRALVEGLLPLVQPAARHAGVEVQLQLDEGCSVNGIADRLSQAVLNLLLNAIEAATQGSASAGLRRVCVRLEQTSADRVILGVSDSGPGPAVDVRERLFEPFVTEKPDGVGLGLSVVRGIVEQHGGQISWQRSGNITNFTMELPTRASEVDRVEAIGCR
mgnify:CR=1 FL=1